MFGPVAASWVNRLTAQFRQESASQSLIQQPHGASECKPGV